MCIRDRYDSTYSDYNVVKMTPSHRDVVRELAEEVRRAGLKMCVYYSHALDLSLIHI